MHQPDKNKKSDNSTMRSYRAAPGLSQTQDAPGWLNFDDGLVAAECLSESRSIRRAPPQTRLVRDTRGGMNHAGRGRAGFENPAQMRLAERHDAVEALASDRVHSRNSNPKVLMVEPTENWQCEDAAEPL
jgi:hypothetical protein